MLMSSLISLSDMQTQVAEVSRQHGHVGCNINPTDRSRPTQHANIFLIASEAIDLQFRREIKIGSISRLPLGFPHRVCVRSPST
jgi:hypothetical protein